jgi:hypothetical protein
MRGGRACTMSVKHANKLAQNHINERLLNIGQMRGFDYRVSYKMLKRRNIFIPGASGQRDIAFVFCPSAVVRGHRCEVPAIDNESEDSTRLQISHFEFDFLTARVA